MNRFIQTVEGRDDFSWGNCVRSISIPKSDVSESNGLSLLSNGLVNFLIEYGSSSVYKNE